LSGKKICRVLQDELMTVIGNVKVLTKSAACAALMLKERRYYRWRHRQPHLPKRAWNRITLAEEEAILEAGRDEKLVDLRAAGLMVYGHETGKYYCSLSTIQRVLIRNKLQAPYCIPTRRRPAKPDIRSLMDGPGKIFSYDATEFYLISRLRVVVIPILDLGSRKFVHYRVRVTSFTQKDVMEIFDEALFKEGIDASTLTVLSDRGGQMKGSRTKAHLIGRWDIRLEFARPYTPDDNAWIEAFIKYMKYHPECPESFETVRDVMDWVDKFQKLYNDHPHSALGYVRPNDEHAGFGKAIRAKRRENLLTARKTRLGYYHSQKAGVSGYGLSEDQGPAGIVDENLGMEKTENKAKAENGAWKAIRDGDFRNNSLNVLCQNR
jgi:putative transposase